MISRLYVENGVGKRVTEGINLFASEHGVRAFFQNDVHPEMQRKQHGDDWWIRDVAAREMAIFTQDRAILDREREAVIESQAIVFALGNAEYTVWHKFRVLARNWDFVAESLDEPGPCGVVIWLSSKPHKVI